MYLLDTNACLDFLLARQPAIAPRIRQAFGSLAVSTITVAELRVGNRHSADPVRDAAQVDMFLSGVAVAAFDVTAAARYGDMVRAIGLERTNFDRLIAAHALALNAVLITRNARDFADVPGLRVEDWTK